MKIIILNKRLIQILKKLKENIVFIQLYKKTEAVMASVFLIVNY